MVESLGCTSSLDISEAVRSGQEVPSAERRWGLGRKDVCPECAVLTSEQEGNEV